MAPDSITAIVEGRQSATLTARSLMVSELPLAWSDQRALPGLNRVKSHCSQDFNASDGGLFAPEMIAKSVLL